MSYNTFTKFVDAKYPGITMNTNSFSGDIPKGARITGLTSGAIGTVYDWNPSISRMVILKTSGNFVKGEQATTVMVRNEGMLEGGVQFGQYQIATSRATHHYENIVDGNTLDYAQFLETAVSDRREVSNILYETELNDAKRKVKLIKPQYVQQIVEQMSAILNPKKSVV